MLLHLRLRLLRPYYLYQCDIARGTAHFRTPVACGLSLIQSLRGFTTGHAVPTYVIDTPGGGGKIPIYPDYVISQSPGKIIVKNYKEEIFVYPDMK